MIPTQMLVLGIVLRSSFDAKQSSIILSPKEVGPSTILINGIVGKKICDFLLLSKTPIPPSLLVHHDDSSDTTHMFLHYNYTIFRSFWGSDYIAINEKINVFTDMTCWLNDYNQTLKGVFQDEQDYLAWNIASFIDDGGEYHYD